MNSCPKPSFVKSLFFSILIFGSFFISHAQVLKPVTWSFSTKPLGNDEVELQFNAKIDKGWHLYSQFVDAGGPLPTEFKFEPVKDIRLLGKVNEPKPVEVFDDIFQMKVKYFNGAAVFRQKVKVTSPKPVVVKGTFDYMCCDDERCIPFNDNDFEFRLEGAKGTVQQASAPPDAGKTVSAVADTSQVKADTVPQKKTESVGADEKAKIAQATDAITGGGRSLWGFFLVAILAGLAAIFTPCVFPMIPMTVTFFMHDNENKRKSRFQAIVYGFSIILIYTVIGTLVALTLGANFANWLSTHWIPNVFFFLIFMVFAASFLGMFEITLPSWLVTKADMQAEKGGMLAPFFMAFTLVLVSFSCTGPLVGAILVESAGGQALKPIIGMFGFSLAFALPFTLFAFFPSWLSGLPKSGGWLNSVKVVLGFIELALGLKFLSIADQTYHWHILDREIYLAFWIVIFTLMGFYLLGKLKFAHDSDLKHISVPRIVFAIITFSFVIYMFPGMFGAPLKALAGYMPPQTTQDFDLNAIIRDNTHLCLSAEKTQPAGVCEKPKFSEFLHLPHGLSGYFDYDQALACSKSMKKPIFIDFTGHGCVNCREMEARVWSDPKVLSILQNKYIVTALYVDDKTELPQKEWITSKYDGKVKKTIGKKYADYQISRFNVNAQPYYVLLDTNGNLLVPPRAYNLNVDGFVAFLESGLKEFEKKK